MSKELLEDKVIKAEFAIAAVGPLQLISEAVGLVGPGYIVKNDQAVVFTAVTVPTIAVTEDGIDVWLILTAILVF